MATSVANPECFLCVQEMCVYIADDEAFTQNVFKLPRIESAQVSTTEEKPEKRADSDTGGLRVTPCTGTVEQTLNLVGNACLSNWIEQYVQMGDVKYLRIYPDCNDGAIYRDLKVRFGAFDFDPLDNNSADPVQWRNEADVVEDLGWTGISDPANKVTVLPTTAAS